MKKDLPLSLGLALGNALGSVVYDTFLKGERVFELPKYIFMFVLSFVAILVVLSLIRSSKEKQSSESESS